MANWCNIPGNLSREGHTMSTRKYGLTRGDYDEDVEASGGVMSRVKRVLFSGAAFWVLLLVIQVLVFAAV